MQISKAAVFLLACIPLFSFSQADSSLTESDSLPRQKFLIGIPIFRAGVGDAEISFLFKVANRRMAGVPIGSDVNFFDTKSEQTGPSQYSSELSGTSNEEWERYFWGKGACVRINYDFLYLSKKMKRERFISVEALYKVRNYENYFFRRDDFLFLESGKQFIAGLSLLNGTNYSIGKKAVARLSYGIGARYISGEITRPGYTLYGTVIPENKIHKSYLYPSVHFGVTVMVNP